MRRHAQRRRGGVDRRVEHGAQQDAMIASHDAPLHAPSPPTSMIGHDLQRANHRRMVPRLAAMRRAGVEQLLRRGGVGQRDAERLGALQGEIEVLLVKFDPEAGRERAFDHALAVHLEDSRGREAAHQRLAHAGGIGAGLGGEQQRFGDRLDVEGDDDLIGDLGGLPVAVAADQRDVLAQLLEDRLHRVEGLLRAADHDRQRGRLGADLAARNRRVEIVGARAR